MRIHFLLFAVAFSLTAQDVPRPEYPQPQFQREQWQTLNGHWEFEFDDANAGLNEDWAAGSRKFSAEHRRALRSGDEEERHRRHLLSSNRVVSARVTLPAGWNGKRVLLHFGAVDYRARVWVNGRSLGEHEGGNVPFQFDITGPLKAGANVITVRAEDPPTDRYIPRGKQYWEPKSRGIFYTRTTRHLAAGLARSRRATATSSACASRHRIDGDVRFEARDRASGSPIPSFTPSCDRRTGRLRPAHESCRGSARNGRGVRAAIRGCGRRTRRISTT